MVLAEKGSESVRNGRRSRGPSPNGHAAADDTSDEENTVPVDKIRVGRDYQAVCPELQPLATRRPDQLADRALLVWSPTVDISEQKLDEYITLAKEKYGYNGEQALGMLFWHKHDLERAVLDLANFTPFPDEWSVEDKVLFEQAFQFHGKSFHRIRQMLPDKTIASLVKYYYSWKKTRSRTSLMDKQARKLTAPREEGAASEAGSEGGSNEESDVDEKVQENKQTISALKRKTSEGIDDIRSPTDSNTSRINARWTNEELLLAVQGVRKYGKDFKTIAETLGTKTESHLRTFFANYRRRYNLDNVLREYEKENGPLAGSGDDQNTNATTVTTATTTTTTTTNTNSNTAATTNTTGVTSVTTTNNTSIIGTTNNLNDSPVEKMDVDLDPITAVSTTTTTTTSGTTNSMDTSSIENGIIVGATAVSTTGSSTTVAATATGGILTSSMSMSTSISTSSSLATPHTITTAATLTPVMALTNARTPAAIVAGDAAGGNNK